MPASAGASLLLISPVRNEAAHLDGVARGLAGQTVRPDRWLVVDDGSTDGTLELLRGLERELGFLRVISSSGGERSATDRLAVAAEARAFNEALATEPWREFAYLGKLDGDVELPPDYFERLLAEFRSRPRLGVAGGRLVERHDSRLREIRIPAYHVHGATKLYRRECFEAIGGIQERLGWDTIDETYARMHGYETRSFPELVGLHHRPMASADGVLRGRARHGYCAYVVRYGPLWTALRSLKVATQRPLGLSGAAFLYGYLAGHVRRAPRVEDPDFKRFVRRELRGRMLDALRPGGRSAGVGQERVQLPPEHVGDRRPVADA